MILQILVFDYLIHNFIIIKMSDSFEDKLETALDQVLTESEGRPMTEEEEGSRPTAAFIDIPDEDEVNEDEDIASHFSASKKASSSVQLPVVGINKKKVEVKKKSSTKTILDQALDFTKAQINTGRFY